MRWEVALVYTFSKAIRKKHTKYALYGLVSGYTCAWVGHFMFEKINLPVLNNRFIALFLIGECSPMLRLVG